MNVSLICATSENNVIGVNNRLPWRLPADLKRFKELTLNHTVVMGRKTYESIGKALPERINVVITRNKEFKAPDCLVASSVEEALALCKEDAEIFVIGGASIYQQALPYANRIYLTKIDVDFVGDAYSPKLDQSVWRKVEEDPHPPDANNPYPYRFLILEKPG